MGDPGLIPGSGRSPGEGSAYPLQYSCLENSMDRGAWKATVHDVAESRTRLSTEHARIRCSWSSARHTQTHTHTHTHTLSQVSCVESWVILKCAWNSDVPGQVQKVPSAVLAEQILSLQLPSCTCSKVPDIQFWNNSNRSQIDSLQTTRTK